MQVETKALDGNLAFCADVFRVFSMQDDEEKMTSEDEYKKSLEACRGDLCPTLNAVMGVVFDETKLNIEKIYFDVIQVVAIKMQITIKLEPANISFDFTDPRRGFGLLAVLYPFV